jgi:ABC-type Fe3+-siderophore transport system permease subunit
MFADRPAWLLGVVGGLAVVIVVVFAVGVGSVAISPVDTLRVLADRILPIDLATSPIADPIVWNIRLPRVLAALGAGAALGTAGVSLQGLFRNPIADPQLVGMSAVGSVGVLVGLWIGWSAGGPVAGVVGGAIAGALGAFVVRLLAAMSEADPSHLILTGIGIGVAISAVVAAAAIAIHDPRIPDLPFWFVGGLSASTWGTAGWVLAFAGLSLAWVLPHAGSLDVLSLGFSSAGHVGIDVRRVVTIVLVATGLGVGAAVGAAGVIAFVGLIAGHGARKLGGEHHSRALPIGFALGGVVLVLADAFGRLLGGRFEVPAGLIMAIVGGPFLAWSITRRRSRT